MGQETEAVSPKLADSLVRSCRTVVGDQRRSGTYFDPTDETRLYLRDHLSADADVVGFANNERLGFRSQSVYDDTELGEYLFTIHAFERAYLTRVIVGDRGAFVTTDELSVKRFRDLANTHVDVLEEYGERNGFTLRATLFGYGTVG